MCVCVLVTQSHPTLCDPMDCNPPGFSVHGILQAWQTQYIILVLNIYNIILTSLHITFKVIYYMKYIHLEKYYFSLFIKHFFKTFQSFFTLSLSTLYIFSEWSNTVFSRILDPGKKKMMPLESPILCLLSKRSSRRNLFSSCTYHEQIWSVRQPSVLKQFL